MAVELITTSDLEPEVQTSLKAVFAALNVAQLPDVPAGHVNLKLVDDDGIRALNSKYSGQDEATDVLSFSYIENGQEAAEGELGDIAISLPAAERQAKAAGTALATEIALLTLHGVLHILGYDHAEAGDQAKVDGLQSQIMSAAGLIYRKFTWKS